MTMNTGEIILRLFLAVFLGGIIGYEREHTNRPAGFRTHILVCVGAALVMVTSEYIFNKYAGTVNLDPARLGAQVISGIGFLGAGTIIRDGNNVRGLTTAASLWAVSCVGIAVGIGFYGCAILATLVIFITLIILKKAEQHFSIKSRHKTIVLEYDNIPEHIEDVSSLLIERKVEIKNIYLSKNNENIQIIKINVKLPKNSWNLRMVCDLQKLTGVKKIYEE